MIRMLAAAAVMTFSSAAWAAIASCEQSCKDSVKACTDECIKRQPKNKHPDCKKACGQAEQPCLETCKKK